MKLSEAAIIVNGKLVGADCEFHQLETDSRKIKPGDLYIARIGNNLNGHDFVKEAQQNKAAAAMVQYAVECDIPQLQVEDSTQALGQLAAHHRQQFDIPLITVTGSCGKTTVKTLIANILKNNGSVLAPEASFNNNVGMPLTLLKLNASHRYAVMEIGMNHFGEISQLTAIAKPTVALITNAAPAHLEGVGDLMGVARAKGEIFQGLATHGIAILNKDDKFVTYWESLVPRHDILYFSTKDSSATLFAKDIKSDNHGKAAFILVTPAGQLPIQLALLGEHNVANALAAAAAAFAINIPLTAIKVGLESAQPEKKRLNEYYTASGAYIIDDTYNANPLSVRAAIDLLAQQKGEKILVLGDMRELGEKAATYHRELGAHARQKNIKKLYLFGELSKFTAEGFGETAQHFDKQTALIDALKLELPNQPTLLVKGSRSMQMEKIVEALMDKGCCSH